MLYMIKLMTLSTALRFKKEEDGVALTEYLVLLGLLTAALIAAVIAFGGALTTAWGSWTTWFGSNLGAP